MLGNNLQAECYNIYIRKQKKDCLGEEFDGSNFRLDPSTQPKWTQQARERSTTDKHILTAPQRLNSRMLGPKKGKQINK